MLKKDYINDVLEQLQVQYGKKTKAKEIISKIYDCDIKRNKSNDSFWLKEFERLNNELINLIEK